MDCKLSILIATLSSRFDSFNSLTNELFRQIAVCRAEGVINIICYSDSGEKSIGQKRNELVLASSGDYVCHFDDDDYPSENYIKNILAGIKSGADCCSLRGVITFDGENPEFFEHSIKYKEYKTTEKTIKYERYPNHLNVIKSEIAKQFKFPEINHGEDTDWATQILASGLIKSEYFIDEVIYNYNFKTNK